MARHDGEEGLDLGLDSGKSLQDRFDIEAEAQCRLSEFFGIVECLTDVAVRTERSGPGQLADNFASGDLLDLASRPHFGVEMFKEPDDAGRNEQSYGARCEYDHPHRRSG